MGIPVDHTKKCKSVNKRDNFTIVCKEPNRNTHKGKSYINLLTLSLISMVESFGGRCGKYSSDSGNYKSVYQSVCYNINIQTNKCRCTYRF